MAAEMEQMADSGQSQAFVERFEVLVEGLRRALLTLSKVKS
jgi:hypothetical protein